MSSVHVSKIDLFTRSRLQHYNENKYWNYRESVVSYSKGLFNKLLCTYKLYYIKKCDAFNCASLGTHMGFGAQFKSIPRFPHGLYGIVISHNAVIGVNAVIYHQVTIGGGERQLVIM